MITWSAIECQWTPKLKRDLQSIDGERRNSFYIQRLASPLDTAISTTSGPSIAESGLRILRLCPSIVSLSLPAFSENFHLLHASRISRCLLELLLAWMIGALRLKATRKKDTYLPPTGPPVLLIEVAVVHLGLFSFANLVWMTYPL